MKGGTPRYYPEVNAICLCVVIDILSMFPRLRAFEIRAINLNFNACCSTPPAQPFSPIDIKYLNLADLTSCNASLQPVIKLLGLFNRIHSLQIVEVWVHGDAREGADELAKSTINKDLAELPSSWSPSLALLTIAGTPEGMFAPYTHILTTRNMLGDLEELNIQCCNWEDLPCAAAIISSNKGLSELTIDVSTLIMQEVEVDNEEDLLSMTIQPDRWKDFKLSSLHSLRYFETSVKLFIPESKEDFPTVQPSVRGFQYMLDFLSHAPRSIEDLTIVLKFEWSDQYRQSLSQDYDWGRLATIIYSFPAIKTANIIVADRSPAFLAVSAQCGRIVMNGFTRSSKIRENNRVIRILCQHADYDNFLLDTDV
ncbi:hypothetical protein QCA50_008482 [Cerrena zonata]|uniref:Uncharacterized protein n=1 Tax=Cerrena zonata TaxID=2478898 RepID=A0AAW0G9A3_9APHY